MISLEQRKPVLARGVRLRRDPLTDEPILLFPEGVLPLDDTTYDIVTRCSGDSTVESIILALADEYEVDQETLRGDVCECLEQLREQMLIAIPQ
jgi:pyrroloquinoline quinone biosynthesis protein D